MNCDITRRGLFQLAGAGALAASAGKLAFADYPHPSTASAGLNLPGTFDGEKYTLPDLPYPDDALDPAYQKKALRIHHDRHHAGYVKAANKTQAKLAQARQAGDFSAIKALSRDLAFALSGHVLHSLFWLSMKPGGSAMPESLAVAMKKSFGTIDSGKSQFAAASKAVEGSGWGVLAYEPLSRSLVISQLEKHQNLAIISSIPLLVCDVWEHAYYLQYRSDRPGWVKAFMSITNWEFAAKRYVLAKQI